MNEIEMQRFNMKCGHQFKLTNQLRMRFRDDFTSKTIMTQ